MPDSKSISELITAEQTTANDIFENAIPNAMTETGFVSRKLTFATLATWICNTFQFASQLQTTAKTIIGAINEAASGGYTEATGTLTAGQTTVTINNAAITTTSTIDPYVDPAFTGVNPTGTTLAAGSVTLTFPVQSSDMPVKVRIS